MQVTINVPDNLSQAMLNYYIQEFEDKLNKVAQENKTLSK